VERFSSAYGLPPDRQQALRAELVSRLPAQWQFEQQGFKDLNAKLEQAVASGADESSPEAASLAQDLSSIGQLRPLACRVVATSFIEKDLPPEAARDGRARLEELLQRRDLMVATRDSDLDQQALHNGDLSELRAVSAPPLSQQGNPLPRQDK